MISLILIYLFLAIFYFHFLNKIYKGLNYLGSDNNNHNSLKVSVLIPFRNEEKNLINSLRSLESQNYPAELLEIIYINDNSEDNSKELLKANISGGNIRIIEANPQTGAAFKKRSVQAGIKAASGEIIITTDADCTHHSNWLNKIVTQFDDKTGLVSGPVAFSSSGSLFNKLQALEFKGLILAGAGLIGAGEPTICNGANLAYRKQAFLEAGGFNDNIHLASGDDELLMQKIASMKKWQIKFCAEKDAIVVTEANKNIQQFLEQRKRWASKGMFYKNKHLIFRLFLIFLFYLSLPLQLILAAWLGGIFWSLLLFSLAGKLFMEYRVIQKGNQLLFEKENFFLFILAEIVQIPYIIFSSIGGVFGNFKWKGRSIKR